MLSSMRNRTKLLHTIRVKLCHNWYTGTLQWVRDGSRIEPDLLTNVVGSVENRKGPRLQFMDLNPTKLPRLDLPQERATRLTISTRLPWDEPTRQLFEDLLHPDFLDYIAFTSEAGWRRAAAQDEMPSAFLSFVKY